MVNIQKLQSRGLKALSDDSAEALQELVAKIGVLFAPCAQTRSVEGKRPRELHGAGVKPPAVGWDQPRPTEDIALRDHLDDHGATLGHEDFEGHLALADSVEGVGLFALMEDVLSRLEAYIRSAVDEF